ncbi:Mnd1 family protein [Trichomonas vaginalis G3]|uniref:Mnd1 family protein n=1 Tax=Trichomonas vaginalis (strain ATCC PRA-98 / G3) TaxID=412133 RepID=A2DK07_TRIV3|nr:homologous recombination [Trichomonas vaginalis G3]EAY19178.1 Mnd1 family protein [Trichomonas vaginalis G3]KAI5548461.1 homologous recombination [Trichomonas vaginalis G3]|eukprot:XP_001580164.1 Mnd1 family protein [Trichomonas vaginalis G3]
MSRKKGMSREEKLLAMQELMMESQDIWTLKDLERDCPKKKGITSMSVKEILQELCDNDLVSFEKIGSGNFYWCFPSEAFNRRKVLEGKLQAQITELESEISGLQAEIADLEPGREPCQERTELDEIVEKFGKELASIQAESAKYDSLNPNAIRKTQEYTKKALESANRWTDNVYTLKSWIVKTYMLNPSAFDEQFGIGEGFDYFQ